MSIPVYDTLDELWLGAAAMLLGYGQPIPSRDGQCTELLGYVGRLANPQANFMFNPVRKMSVSYAAAEMLWYLSGTTDTTMLQAYAPQYKRFTEDGVHAYGSYGDRWRHDNEYVEEQIEAAASEKSSKLWEDHSSQLETLIKLLKNKPESRQAVVTMWNAGDLIHAFLGDRNDLPCTLSLAFSLRDNKLNCVGTMRSNDIWLGTPYDIWAFCCVQQLVAEALGVELGWYQHQANSLHVYDRNMEHFKSAANPTPFNTAPLQYVLHPGHTIINGSIGEALRLEEWHRTMFKGVTNIFNGLPEDSLLGQLVVMAASKWTGEAAERITNKIMRSYLC